MAASEQPPDLEPAGEDAPCGDISLIIPGFFKAPDLSDADQAELLSWGRSLVPDLLCEDRQKGGLTYSIRAVATVRVSLDDVMDIFLAKNTVDYRSLMQLQLREFFADAAVLFHKEQNESESLSIKWTAARTKKSVASLGGQVGVDLCLLEYAGVISSKLVGGTKQYNALNDSSSSNTSRNSPVGVCLYESIDQAECPSLYDSHKPERASVSNFGFLFRPHVDEDVVENTFNRALLAHWAQSVGGIEESNSRRRISKELTRRRVPMWVKDKDRACCHLCLKTFTNTRRKHHCRACVEIICRACSVYKSVDLQSVGLTTLRVCKACMDDTSSAVDRDEANLKAAAAVTAAANGATADKSNLPEGVDNSVLRDSVEEYALAVPGAQVSTAPDLVGIAWLQQLAARDDESKTMSVDENRQWFKSAVNVKESEVPRDFGFCEYSVRDQRPLVVMDTLRDPRFKTATKHIDNGCIEDTPPR
ncbi:hypothetical protein PInf_008673 [Phytophthora infestans]|nr:hypothetical protein PInf_008673 [Phytophthora infestans]